MDNIKAELILIKDLIEEHGISKDRFCERYAALLDDMETYIQKAGWTSNEVQINKYSLGYALVDYFVDIGRLKTLHPINHVNSIKIVSYIAFWLLKRKPIQALGDQENLLYVNEKFVLLYILEHLSNSRGGNLLDRSEKGLEAFKDTLYYYLKYRLITAQSLEIILMAFFAGQIYENTEQDLSSKLPESEI